MRNNALLAIAGATAAADDGRNGVSQHMGLCRSGGALLRSIMIRRQTLPEPKPRLRVLCTCVPA